MTATRCSKFFVRGTIRLANEVFHILKNQGQFGYLNGVPVFVVSLENFGPIVNMVL